MFDTHCHLDADEYDDDRGEVLARAQAAGIAGIFVPGYRPRQWRTLGEFCGQDPRLCYGLGLHPWYLRELSHTERDAALEELATALAVPEVVALGECGLDSLHSRRGGTALEEQVRVLAVEVELAREHELPLVLHCVRAHGALLELLEAGGPLPRGGVLHSYSGPADLIARYVRLGLSFSFAPTLLRADAKRPKLAAAAVPLERLVVESDGPDQAPRELGATRSEPAHIALVIRELCALRGLAEAELRAQTSANAVALFARRR